MTNPSTPGDPMLDHRARLERAQLEATERRQAAMAEQRSVNSSPAQRVAAWERLHHLLLPSDPGHPILGVVAQQTELDLAQVRGVQRDRKATAG